MSLGGEIEQCRGTACDDRVVGRLVQPAGLFPQPVVSSLVSRIGETKPADLVYPTAGQRMAHGLVVMPTRPAANAPFVEPTAVRVRYQLEVRQCAGKNLPRIGVKAVKNTLLDHR